MKKNKIIFGALFAVFLMLSTIAINPVSAQIPIDPPQEKDGEQIIPPNDTKLTQLTNSLIESVESFTSSITANDELDILIERIENNKEVQKLIEQIQNTDNEKQKHLLAEQLINLLKTLPEYQQIQKLLCSSDFTSEINDINQDIDMLLSYIDSLSNETNIDMESSDSETSFDSANSNSYLNDVSFVMPAGCMVEYQYVFYPDEETNVPNPTGGGNLTYGDILDKLQDGDLTLEDLQDLVESGDLTANEFLQIVGQFYSQQTGDVEEPTGIWDWIWAYIKPILWGKIIKWAVKKTVRIILGKIFGPIFDLIWGLINGDYQWFDWDGLIG